jgi:hypothetical protein
MKTILITGASTGGQIAPPFIGAYAGSKHAIEGLSHSLRRELQRIIPSILPDRWLDKVMGKNLGVLGSDRKES